jgi:hypothetical protein
MLSSLFVLMSLQVGCLAGDPPADCPPADCTSNDSRPACQLDGAVQRQLKVTWKSAQGISKHGMMVKQQSAERPKVSVKPPSSRGRILRCSAGVALVGGGVWLALDKNWMNRSLGVLSAGAGLWLCAKAG